jgi:hypothetical protein
MSRECQSVAELVPRRWSCSPAAFEEDRRKSQYSAQPFSDHRQTLFTKTTAQVARDRIGNTNDQLETRRSTYLLALSCTKRETFARFEKATARRTYAARAVGDLRRKIASPIGRCRSTTQLAGRPHRYDPLAFRYLRSHVVFHF